MNNHEPHGNHICPYCNQPHFGHPDLCRHCWYQGRMLADNMAGVIRTLNAATGSNWDAEHTGGGCFALITRPFGFDDDGEGPAIVLTSEGGALSGSDEVAHVEADGGTWLLGAYLSWEQAGEDGNDICWYDLHTKQVPGKAREAMAWLTEQRKEQA